MRFQGFSSQAAKSIEDAKNLGLFYQEETITETLLLELARHCQNNVKIKSFKRLQESRNGSDWEWWISSNRKWLPMRVQAKKTNLKGDGFNRLLKYQAKSAPSSQIITLIQSATVDGLLPAYCFYVGSDAFSLNQSGCFIASASKVKSLASEKLAVLSKISHPWHHLVCSCRTGSNFVPAILDAFLRDDEQDVSKYLKDSLPDYLANWNETKMIARAKERKLAGFIKIEIID